MNELESSMSCGVREFPMKDVEFYIKDVDIPGRTGDIPKANMR